MNDNNHNSIVKQILESHFPEEIIKIERMVVGICNEVYLGEYSRKKVIIRMNTNEKQLMGTARNIDLFTSVNIKVPKILAFDYTKTFVPYAYQILSYIEGKDVGQVIESMTDDELKDLAKEIANIFRKLSVIPTNGKFGWVGIDESKTVDSWATIIKADKVEERNNQTGVVGEELVQIEKDLYKQYLPYFNSIKSTLYFDDLSSKNVLVDQGKFTGLIDLDEVMYGDPLEAVGSIKASWHGTHYGEMYTNALQDDLQLSTEERKIVTVYALLNRIIWLSEKGVKFNDNTSTEIDWNKVNEDKEVIWGLMAELKSKN